METDLAEMPEKGGENCGRVELVAWKDEIPAPEGKTVGSGEVALGWLSPLSWGWMGFLSETEELGMGAPPFPWQLGTQWTLQSYPQNFCLPRILPISKRRAQKREKWLLCASR
ncbi:forkhead box O3B, partial [Homo sapiens]